MRSAKIAASDTVARRSGALMREEETAGVEDTRISLGQKKNPALRLGEGKLPPVRPAATGRSVQQAGDTIVSRNPTPQR